CDQPEEPGRVDELGGAHGHLEERVVGRVGAGLRGAHQRREQGRDPAADEDDAEEHAPPQPGGEDLADLRAYGASHHATPSVVVRLRLTFSGASVSSKNSASRSASLPRSSWTATPAARATSPIWRRSPLWTVRAPSSIGEDASPAR